MTLRSLFFFVFCFLTESLKCDFHFTLERVGDSFLGNALELNIRETCIIPQRLMGERFVSAGLVRKSCCSKKSNNISIRKGQEIIYKV